MFRSGEKSDMCESLEKNIPRTIGRLPDGTEALGVEAGQPIQEVDGGFLQTS